MRSLVLNCAILKLSRFAKRKLNSSRAVYTCWIFESGIIGYLMELKIEQALQQGVAAHKEGKLQEAERLYQAILQSQPKHPDANHNLGLIAVAANKVDAALPLFKTALEANPKIEQFWLSYIDTLIKGKQSEVAKQVIEQAEKQGVSREKINVFERQLQSPIQDDNAQPSDTEINTLLQY